MQAKHFSVCFIILLLFGCTQNEQVSLKAPNSNSFQDIYSQLKDGDIVLRRGRDITSEMMRIMNKSDQRFSHCGFVFTINGTKMVYHIVGGEENPESIMRLERLDKFYAHTNNLAVGVAKMTYEQEELLLLKRSLDNMLKAQIPFDLHFNIESDDSLYCTEMVAKSLKHINPKIIIPFTDTLGQKFYTIQNVTDNSRVISIVYLKY